MEGSRNAFVVEFEGFDELTEEEFKSYLLDSSLPPHVVEVVEVIESPLPEGATYRQWVSL